MISITTLFGDVIFRFERLKLISDSSLIFNFWVFFLNVISYNLIERRWEGRKKNQNDQHNLSIGITPFFIIADGIHLSIPILSAPPSFFFSYIYFCI